MKITPQQIVLERYRITRAIGAGTMGEVYLARHLTLGREVAVKVLRERRSSEGALRFEREAQIMAHLRHRRVVNIFDYGVLEDGSPCIVMEYVQGISLGAHLRAQGTLAWRQACRLMCHVVEALGALHDLGFVHRDVKPDNILLDLNGERPEAKLTDFGVARSLGGALGEVKITRAGTLVGTPAYMAPEQLFGEPAGPESDLYAVGVILHELLSGAIPDSPTTLNDLRRRLTRPARPPQVPAHQPELPAKLAHLLIKELLSADRHARLASATLLHERLKRLMAMPDLGAECSTQVWEDEALAEERLTPHDTLVDHPAAGSPLVPATPETQLDTEPDLE